MKSGMPAPTDTSQINGERYPTLTVPTIGPWPKFQSPLRLGVMASGSGTNFEALQASISAGDLDAELRLLVVNNPGCGAMARAKRLGIACELRDHRRFASREALDHELVRTLAKVRPHHSHSNKPCAFLCGPVASRTPSLWYLPVGLAVSWRGGAGAGATEEEDPPLRARSASN